MADDRPRSPIEITEADLKAAIRHTLVYNTERQRWRKDRPLIDMVRQVIHRFRSGNWWRARKP